tara:strand:+ start:1346 stop:1471 length:126 start_codon:yes stop_codon:yes gene_type:complete
MASITWGSYLIAWIVDATVSMNRGSLASKEGLLKISLSRLV